MSNVSKNGTALETTNEEGALSTTTCCSAATQPWEDERWFFNNEPMKYRKPRGPKRRTKAEREAETESEHTIVFGVGKVAGTNRVERWMAIHSPPHRYQWWQPVHGTKTWELLAGCRIFKPDWVSFREVVRTTTHDIGGGKVRITLRERDIKQWRKVTKLWFSYMQKYSCEFLGRPCCTRGQLCAECKDVVVIMQRPSFFLRGG